MSYLACNLLESLDFLLHGFGTRGEGTCQALGIDPRQVFTVNQVHGNGVLVLDEQLVSNWRRGDICTPISADALLTDQPGVALGVLTADCLPIIMVDTERRAIAIVHAGWRGTSRGISQRALSGLAEYFAGSAANWLIGMGPCIGRCCYEVGGEVVEIFRKNFPDWQAYCTPDKGDKWRLDLIAANYAQLLDCGVKPENIAATGYCTACHPAYFFSHRRDPGEGKRMMSLVMLKPV
jgi:hypothetical protein